MATGSGKTSLSRATLTYPGRVTGLTKWVWAQKAGVKAKSTHVTVAPMYGQSQPTMYSLHGQLCDVYHAYSTSRSQHNSGTDISIPGWMFSSWIEMLLSLSYR